MTLRFLPQAEYDYQDAFDYYDAIEGALADQFAVEVEATVASFRTNPFRRPIVSGNIRRCLVKRFPFGIYYVCADDWITVVAIMHQSRNPLVWKKRG